MNRLPPELSLLIIQYNKLVFPADSDLQREDYHKLLDYTIKNNRPGQLKILLAYNKPFSRINAIKSAIAYKHISCLCLLLEGTSELDKKKILYDCIKARSLEILILVLLHVNSSIFNEVLDREQSTDNRKLLLTAQSIVDDNPIYWAVYNNRVETLKCLIKYLSVDANAIHIATNRGHTECLSLLNDAS